jgi:hypothetical protein
MTFIELMRQLENSLGSLQLPVNIGACDIKKIFDGGPLHHDLAVRLVRAIYKSNRCQKMSDDIDQARTFEAITPIRQELLQKKTTDIDAYHFMDDFCQALGGCFNQGYRPGTADEKASPAEIIELASKQHIRRLKTWA